MIKPNEIIRTDTSIQRALADIMKDQIKELPGFEKVEREVQRHLKKLKF